MNYKLARRVALFGVKLRSSLQLGSSTRGQSRSARQITAPVRRSTSAITVAALLASTLITTVGPTTAAFAAGGETGTVAGTVFQSYGTEGWQTQGDAGVADSTPVPGITITAYDAEGDIVGSAQSAADGTYAINIVGAYSDDLRVEFSGWDATLEPAFAAQGSDPSSAVGANDTSVQLVTLGAGDSVSDVDFGLIEPDLVIPRNAPIATAIQSAGSRTSTSAGIPSLVAQPWLSEGQYPESLTGLAEYADFQNTGAVWGMTYSKQTDSLFAAASLKRMSDLGPLGLGGIYRTADVLLPNGEMNMAGSTSGWFSFDGLPVSNAGNTALDIGVSQLAARDLGAPAAPKPEVNAFAKTGRIGLGGIAASSDGTRLFATNLYDGDVYAVDSSNPTTAPMSTYRIETPVTGGQAIWAIEVHEGRMYIGYVDTGDNPGGSADPGHSAASKNLQAYVASTPLSGVMTAPGAAPTWTTELTVDLGYYKGSNLQNWKAYVGPFNNPYFEDEYPQLTRWNSWTDTWNWGSGSGAGSVAMLGKKSDSTDLQGYPQAILSSLAFDSDGYLNLGFLDRNSLQAGNRNVAAVTPVGSDPMLWNGISNGDTLVAAPAAKWSATDCQLTAPIENYVLECQGKVGDRAVRTDPLNTYVGPARTWEPADLTTGVQDPTYNNNQGPGGGEFFNDRRELGTEANALGLQGTGRENHNEVTLGSVTTYPGMTEVATTAIDPRTTAYINGVMWFDTRNGAATRGIDLSGTSGAATGTSSFQKSGGLGDSALLAGEAPVEIGNRVWLDADLNGRQDADEPAINGAVVELWTDDGSGNPGDLIGTRTTKTIDGQPGTYYFRTDDADVMVGNNAHPFVENSSYVLVFKKGSSLELVGPNATNPGFTGLTWGDLQRTGAEVSVTPTVTNGGTTEVNDSNPDVADGGYGIDVGGPGQNNHTYDSGWYATNDYVLSKDFDFGGVSGTPENSYTFDVVAAENFRGQERLGATGAEPAITELTMELTGPAWEWTASEELPIGYTLVLEEQGASGTSVTWDTPVVGHPDQGAVTITPKASAGNHARITATNHLGGFTLTKTVSGDAASKVPGTVEFKVQYTLNGGAEQTAWVSQDEPFTLGGLPLGTEVQIKESTPIVTNPADVPGVDWGTPSWTVGSEVTGPNGDGWYVFTITEDHSSVSLGLDNKADVPKGGFSILKERAAGEPLPDKTFSFQYKIGETGTPVTLGPIQAGETVQTPNTILDGATVFVREIVPTDTANVTWDAPVWSGLPTGATDADGNGWRSFTFDAESDTALKLTAMNKATELFADFSIKKTVSITDGAPDVTGKEFTIEYRTAPAPAAGDEPVFGAPETITLLDGETWSASGDHSFGTVVEMREVAPENTPGVSWATPQWQVNGSPATLNDGWVRFTLNSTTTASFEVNNRATETFGGFTLQKAFDGTGIGLVDGLDYPVEVKIGSDPTETIQLAGNGEVWLGPDGLAIGTEVRVRELTPPAVDGITWGTPSWSAGTGTTLTQDGEWTVFTITSDSDTASLTVTNKPTQVFGSFQLKKTLVVNGDPSVPADYTFEVKIDGVAQADIVLAGGQLSPVIGGLPIGAEVSVREQAPPATAGVDWSLDWKVDGAAVTPNGDGWVTFEITDTTVVSGEATNTATQKFGSFQVAKTVTGDGEQQVPAGTVFTFEYTLDGGDPQYVTATRDQVSDQIGGLPYGTVVTVEEVDFPEIAGIEFNANPVWMLNGSTVTSPVTFTIDSSNLVELSAENTATMVFGSFKLTKQVTGNAADRVPDDASFTVEYSIDNGSSWETLGSVTKGNPTITSDDLPVGTQVLLREVAPTDGVDYVWGTPDFIIDGESQGVTAEITIAEKDTELAVSLNNPASPLNGTFAVQKSVTGDFDLSDPELSDLTFKVSWNAADLGRSGTLELNSENGWKATPSGAQFPRNTTIELTEVEPTGLPANVSFDEYQWAAGTAGVTLSGDGKTATLVVDSGDPAVLQLENTFTELTGTFEVEKIVEGDFQLSDDELKDLAFSVNYDASNGTSGQLTLDAAGNWKAEAGRQFPTGTTVTLTEAQIQQSTLPPNVQWSGYEWVSGDGYTVSADGLTATFTIGDNTSVPLTLQNAFSELYGSFAVQKSVTGVFALTDPALSGQTFTIEYVADNGSTGTLELNAGNGWAAAGGEFPAGTSITLTEVEPTGLAPNVDWTGHRWMPTEGVTVSVDGESATFTVSSDPAPLRLEVENSFSELEGTFGVHKVVEGDFELSDPALSGLEFTVPYTAGNGADGTLTLNQAGEWQASPGEKLPLGTEITLTEADVTGLPDFVQWDGYEWQTGEGYAISDDGLTATLTVTSTTTEPQLTLQNSFTKLMGGFTLTKRITGEKAESVPDGTEFTAEYSLDGGSTWQALPTMTVSEPTVVGPNDVPLGTTVLIREVTPDPIDGVIWGSPAFSGDGVTAGTNEAPASFVITSTETALDVLLENPTGPANGQFSVRKVITGAGDWLMQGNPIFTVKYSYEGQESPGEFTVRAGETASSELIPDGTEVTITELTPRGGLMDQASWGEAVFVTSDGDVLENGSTITIEAGTVIEMVLENPIKPPLIKTGGSSATMALLIALLLGGGGLLIMLYVRRRRGSGQPRPKARHS